MSRRLIWATLVVVAGCQGPTAPLGDAKLPNEVPVDLRPLDLDSPNPIDGTPQTELAAVRDSLTTWIDGRVRPPYPRGPRRQLIQHLSDAIAALDADDVRGATRALAAFLAEVDKRVHSKHLTEDEGQTLHEMISAIQLSVDVYSAGVGGTSTPWIPVNFGIGFQALATFGDGLGFDLSASVDWASSDPTVASIATDGWATALSAGTTTISATDPATGMVGSAELTVGDPDLLDLVVTPANSSIPVGLSRLYAATAVFSDGSPVDATNEVTWSSADLEVAVVDVSVRNHVVQPVVTGVTVGTTTITATLSGVSGSTDVTITDPVIIGLAVTPEDTTIDLSTESLQYTATAQLTDGSLQDVTTTASWWTVAPTVVTIEGSGLVYPIAEGTTRIGATIDGVSGDTGLTVLAPTVTSTTKRGKVRPR